MSDTDEIPDDATPRARERIVALAAERTALRQQLDAVAPKLAEVTTLQAQLAAATTAATAAATEWAAKETAWQTERALLGAGVTDPEAADLVAHAYSRVAAPASGEKPSLSAWLADRASLPKGVLAYLPAPAATTTAAATAATTTGATGATGATTTTAPGATTAKIPPANAGAAAAPGLSGPRTAAEIQELMRTPEGRAEYARIRVAHLAGLRA